MGEIEGLPEIIVLVGTFLGTYNHCFSQLLGVPLEAYVWLGPSLDGFLSGLFSGMLAELVESKVINTNWCLRVGLFGLAGALVGGIVGNLVGNPVLFSAIGATLFVDLKFNIENFH